ncbi:MAG: helix-turn-helix transcriptional regulator [Selenomonadaceae bacterium]|nr:helix-turn-helix transcriptional regulator [Selenomonadaceae bacterium]
MKNELLIAARRRVGKTQRKVAEDIGNAESVYQRYEQGRRTPSVLTAIRIADALGVTDVRELWDAKETSCLNSTTGD